MRGGGLERWSLGKEGRESLGKEGETGRVQGSGSRWTAGYAGEGRAKAGGMMKWAGDRRQGPSILVCPGDAGPDEGLLLIKTSMGR